MSNLICIVNPVRVNELIVKREIERLNIRDFKEQYVFEDTELFFRMRHLRPLELVRFVRDNSTALSRLLFK